MSTEDEFTEDQQFCIDMLSEWALGRHHLPIIRPWGMGVHINWSQDLATFDFDRLTRLVILAHKHAVRIEIRGSTPRMVRIVAHRRRHDSTGCMYERHPALGDLKQRINDLA